MLDGMRSRRSAWAAVSPPEGVGLGAEVGLAVVGLGDVLEVGFTALQPRSATATRTAANASTAAIEPTERLVGRPHLRKRLTGRGADTPPPIGTARKIATGSETPFS